VAIAPVVPQLLHWGSAFDKSVPLILVLALQMVLIGPNMVFGVALVALHRERRWLGVVAASAVLDLTLNFLLIGRTAEMLDNGALGAAIASTATEAFTFLAAVAILPRSMELWRLLPATARLLLIAVVQILAVHALIPVSIFLAVLGVIVVAGTIRLAAAPTDRASMRAATLNRPPDLFVPGEMTRITEGRVSPGERPQIAAKLARLHDWFLDAEQQHADDAPARSRCLDWADQRECICGAHGWRA